MTRHFLALVSFAIILLCVREASAQYRRGSERGYGRRDSGRRDDSPRDGRSSGARRQKFYRFKTAHERLPEGIPEWFVEKDANQDGQVSMAEFATRWNDNLVKEFVQFDRNGDGVVTPKECLAAREAGAVYSGGTLSAKSTAPPTAGGAPPPVAGDRSESSERGAAPTVAGSGSAAESTRTPAESDKQTASTPEDIEIPEAYMKYAIGYVRMYDTDGNGMLTTDEWEKMRKSPKTADRNGDGRVTPQEYALSLMKR
jgi:Ca2+-binding EF-hand superfamily protein